MKRMKKPFKKIALTLAAVIAILTIIIIALSYLINPNNYKSVIATKFYKSTGRNLVLTGPISLSFFPEIHVRAKQLAITNSLQSNSGNFIEIALLDFSIELLPLLKGTFHFTHIAFDGLKLNLIKNKNYNNWSFSGAKGKPRKTSTNLVFNQLFVRDSQVNYQDLDNKETITTKKFNLLINKERGEIKVSNDQLELKNTSIDLNKSLQGILNFKIISEPSLSYDGNFLLKIVSSANLASILNFKIPNFLKYLGSDAKLRSKLTGTETKFNISDLQLTIGNTYISGDLDIGVKPYQINNNLNINQVNLQDLANLQGFRLKVESITVVGKFSTGSQMNGSTLSGLETIKAKNIILYGLDIKQFSANITKVINDISIFKRLITYTRTLETVRLLKQEVQKIQEDRKKNYQYKSSLGQFNGAVMAQNGNMSIKTCNLNGPNLEGLCGGTLDLNKNTINFLLQGRVLPEGQETFINYVYFPYFVRGKLNHPATGLDWAYIVKQTTNYYNKGK